MDTNCTLFYRELVSVPDPHTLPVQGPGTETIGEQEYNCYKLLRGFVLNKEDMHCNLPA